MRKAFPFDDVIMLRVFAANISAIKCCLWGCAVTHFYRIRAINCIQLSRLSLIILVIYNKFLARLKYFTHFTCKVCSQRSLGYIRKCTQWNIILTHWGSNLQNFWQHCQMHFVEQIFLFFIQIIHFVLGSPWKKIIVSGNGLSLNRRQEYTWKPQHRVSLNHEKFMQPMWTKTH